MTLLPLQAQTALVVDVGYIECSVIPVIEGVTLLDAVQFSPLGSQTVHERIASELLEHKALIKDAVTGMNREITKEDVLAENVLEDIKVRTCFVAPHERGQILIKHKRGEKKLDDIQPGCPKDVNYPVDGQKLITIPGLVRESACQVMFEIYGNEASIATMVLDALLKCPRDSRKLLASNLIVVGGTASLPGFKHRLLTDVQNLVKCDSGYKDTLKVEIFKLHKPPCQENYVAWLGAAIFGSTDAITLRAVTRDQFAKSNGTVLSDWSEWWPQSRAG
jgi:actin-related protein 10